MTKKRKDTELERRGPTAKVDEGSYKTISLP